MALTFGFTRSICVRCAVRTSRADTCFLRSRSASSTALISHRSGGRCAADADARLPNMSGSAVPTAPAVTVAVKLLRLIRLFMAKMLPSPPMRVLMVLVLVLGAAWVQKREPRAIAFVGGTVVDVSASGKSAADIRDAAVVVEKDRITAAGPRSTTKIPSDAEVIDTVGKFIVPGLHDVFATINNQAYANAFLYMGVTAIVGSNEPGGRRGPLFTSAVPSPRVYKFNAIVGYDDAGVTPEPRTLPDLMARGRKMNAAELTKQVDDLARDGIKRYSSCTTLFRPIKYGLSRLTPARSGWAQSASSAPPLTRRQPRPA